MNGADVTRLARADPSIQRHFLGVYNMSDDWPEPVSLPACYVINTDDAEGPGEHWVAFFIDKDLSGDFFDSYGMHPMKKTLKWLRERTICVHYNTLWLQSPSSMVCWAYCLYFLRKRSTGATLDEALAIFKQFDFEENDRIVMSFFSVPSD